MVDWDELETGERKEAISLRKLHASAAGITIMITGFALQLSGYVPNAAQEAVQPAIQYLRPVSLELLLPGALLFTRFSLNEEATPR